MISDKFNLPASWIAASLEEVVEIRDDLRQPVNADERAQRVGPYPYYGATGQVGWIDNYLMDGEHILLGEDGAPFLDPTKPKAYRVVGKAWVNNHAHVLFGRGSVLENRYLLHALNNTDYRAFANGTTRLKLTQGAMRRIPIPVAPLNEQRRIVEKIEELFSDLDAGVAALERTKANLKRYRTSVLKAAIDGSLTAEWRAKHPDVESTSKLLERILAERRKKWEADQLAKFNAAGKEPPKNLRGKYVEPSPPDTTNLPELPLGWCWASVEQLSTKVVDGVHKKPNYVASGIPFISVRNLTAGPGISFERIQFIAVEDHAQFIRRANPELGDILISKDGTLGITRVIRTDIEFSIFVSVALVKPIDTKMSDFLEVAFSSKVVQDQMVGKGIGLQHIHLEDLRKDCIPLPSLDEQIQIVNHVAVMLSQIETADIAIDTDLIRAARLRQSILKQAFEGKLVPQDPRDEPASKMLERIKAQAAEATSNGKPTTPKRKQSKQKLS